MCKLSQLLLVWAVLFAAEVSTAREYSRHDFPPDFVFGAGSSAYQIEGAANEDGRTPSIFDTYAHSGGGNGDGCDQYHKYKEDVKLMVETGLEAYRFSISWSRLIPNGRGPVNPKGLHYYNNLIDELTRHGIQPHVTLHHSDLPQALDDEYGGWISRKIVKDFTAYAEVCFREFGDRVRHWTTFNEANVFVLGGYDMGVLPPQRCSSERQPPPETFPVPFESVCSVGNSSTEPYLAGHYILLSHASAAKLYKERYQKKQNGYIGFNIFAYHYSPFTDSSEDLIATERAYKFYVGWMADPLVYGDYPEIMKKNAGVRLPSFTHLESKLVKGSADFLGINFYDAVKVKDNPQSLDLKARDFTADTALDIRYEQNNSSLYGVKPWALQGVLEYFKQNYGNPPIYIHENGQMMPRSSALDDEPRVAFLQGYIGAVLDSLRNGSNTRGYFMWSFLDMFELLDGYKSVFGLYFVDLDDPDLKRYPKLSAHWYSRFLGGGKVDPGSDFSIKLLPLNLTTTSPGILVE